MRGLVLSLFPGLDLFGRAFEAHGWCVVRGPDPVFATDVRGWSAPAGRFDGIIGGPPCQAFSRLSNLVKHNGYETKFGNLIPEFERISAEARPLWFLMEQVPEAPKPQVEGYAIESFLLSPRDLGDVQSRRRRFSFGYRRGESRARLHMRLPLVALESIDKTPAVTSNGLLRYADRKIGGASRSWKNVEEGSEIQGYPELGDHLKDLPFTAEGACHLIGNGVPRVMGEALAGAVSAWLDGEEP